MSTASMVTSLRRRRDLRAGVVQAVYGVFGVTLGLLLATLDWGPEIARDAALPLVVGMAGGFLSFTALVFSLLFLMAQYGNTTISPRLTLFRDDPRVWHSFGYFLAVFLYATSAALRMGSHDEPVSAVVPGVAVLLVLVALGLARSLQLRALGLLHFNTTMEQIRARGEAVLTTIYSRPARPRVHSDAEVPPVATPLRWTRPTTLVRQIDLPRVYAVAVDLDALIVLEVMAGDEVRRGQVVGTVHAGGPVDPASVLGAFDTGTDRTFVQDPLLAFRLLSDIGNRALSSAINDPATAVQAIACTYDLLATIADAELDLGLVTDDGGRPRVRLPLPSWDDYVAAAVDELTFYAAGHPSVRARLAELLTDLIEIVPADRRPTLEIRLGELDRLVHQ